MNRAGPTAARAREPILDVCRGFALLGILLINIELMRGPEIYASFVTGGPAETSSADGVVGFLTGWLAGGKFLSSFAIMFGIGAAMIAGKQWTAGRSPRPLLARRYVFLLVLGLAHMFLLFPGDILFVYGVAGLVLLAFVGVRTRTALWWAGGTLAVLLVLGVGFTALMGAMSQPADDPVAESMELFFAQRADDAVAARQDGTYLDVVAANAWDVLLVQTSSLIVLPWVVALFLIGFAVGRTGIVHNLPAHRDRLRRVVRVALPLGLVLNLPTGFLGPLATGSGMPSGGASGPIELLATAAQIVGAPVLAIGYLAAVALLSLRLGVFRPLAAIGRMALTAYLLQSVLALVVFAWLGLYGRLGTAQSMLVVLAVWGVLLVVCPLWLRRFEFGPVEWVWRAWTYGRPPAQRAG